MSAEDIRTLSFYITLADVLWGPESPQVRFLKDKAAHSPNGEAERVLTDETQMLHLLASLATYPSYPEH
jgi:hypothetical protein